MIPGTTSAEQQRVEIQRALDGRRSAVERNRRGQFATPPALALEIARCMRELWNDGHAALPLRFLDPALGTGAFYSALCATFPAEQIAAARGLELDPEFAAAARGLWASTGLQIATADFTCSTPPPTGQRATLLLANPPYVRHHHLGREPKRRLRELVAERTGLTVSGLSGLYAYFVLLADAWLDEGGLAAWLIPSEFTTVNYGAALRRYLTEQVALLRIHRFEPEDVQFADALVTSAIVIFRKQKPEPAQRVLLSRGGRLDQPSQHRSVSLAELRAAERWPTPETWIGRAPAQATLGDLFEIKRGIATGANDFFILPRSEARARGLPDAWLRPILPPPRALASDDLEADCEGYPALPSPLALVDCAAPEAEVRERWPALWAYLEIGRARGVHARYLARRRTPWYAQEKRLAAPFLCTYMGRAGSRGPGSPPFRFIRNRSQAVAPNVYLLLQPRTELRLVLAAQPDAETRVHDWLRRIAADDLLRQARVYGGGLYKLEPAELASVTADRIALELGLSLTLRTR